MQLSIILLAFLLYGCTPDGNFDNIDQKPAILDENGAITVDKKEKEQGFLLKIKNLILDSYIKMRNLFGLKKEPSPFCQTILEESPTAEEFIKNWSPEDKHMYCQGDEASSCKKKHGDAFRKGLLCYQADLP